MLAELRERGYVWVLDHPYFAVTGADGLPSVRSLSSPAA